MKKMHLALTLTLIALTQSGQKLTAAIHTTGGTSGISGLAPADFKSLKNIWDISFGPSTDLTSINKAINLKIHHKIKDIIGKFLALSPEEQKGLKNAVAALFTKRMGLPRLSGNAGEIFSAIQEIYKKLQDTDSKIRPGVKRELAAQLFIKKITRVLDAFKNIISPILDLQTPILPLEGKRSEAQQLMTDALEKVADLLKDYKGTFSEDELKGLMHQLEGSASGRMTGIRLNPELAKVFSAVKDTYKKLKEFKPASGEISTGLGIDQSQIFLTQLIQYLKTLNIYKILPVAEDKAVALTPEDIVSSLPFYDYDDLEKFPTITP